MHLGYIDIYRSVPSPITSEVRGVQNSRSEGLPCPLGPAVVKCLVGPNPCRVVPVLYICFQQRLLSIVHMPSSGALNDEPVRPVAIYQALHRVWLGVPVPFLVPWVYLRAFMDASNISGSAGWFCAEVGLVLR
jgi:hypothetical protein